MNHRHSLLQSFALLSLWGCASPPPEPQPVDNSWTFDDPNQGLTGETNFSSFAVLDTSLEYAESRLQSTVREKRLQISKVLKTKAANLYVLHRAAMSSEQRARLMKLFIEVGDESMKPLFRHSLKVTAEKSLKKNPVDIVLLVEAYGEGRLPFLATQIFDAFVALQAHTSTGRHLFRVFSLALTKNPQREWTPRLVELIETPVIVPQSLSSKAEKRAAMAPYRDQLFWQTTAMEMLGKLGSAEAAPALLSLYLGRKGADFVPAAKLALVRMGAPAADYAMSGLKGELEPLLEELKALRGRQEGTGERSLDPVVDLVALLAAMRSFDATEKVVIALQGDLLNEERALIAGYLPSFGTKVETVRVFKEVYASLDCATQTKGDSVCSHMAERSPYFFSSDLVPWLLTRARLIERNRELDEVSREEVARNLVLAALRVADSSQVRVLLRATKRYDLEESADEILPFVEGCEEQVSCWTDTLSSLKSESPTERAAGVRAVFTLAALGGTKERDTLLALLPEVQDLELIDWILSAVDALTPRKDMGVMETLGALSAQWERQRARTVSRRRVRELLYSIENRLLAVEPVTSEQGGVEAEEEGASAEKLSPVIPSD